jgi:hypothetical protein
MSSSTQRKLAGKSVTAVFHQARQRVAAIFRNRRRSSFDDFNLVEQNRAIRAHGLSPLHNKSERFLKHNGSSKRPQLSFLIVVSSLQGGECPHLGTSRQRPTRAGSCRTSRNCKAARNARNFYRRRIFERAVPSRRSARTAERLRLPCGYATPAYVDRAHSSRSG